MKPKFITVINDCKSENDIGRQETRYALLFPNTHVSFVGVDSSLGLNTTLEAAGNLADILDASDGKEGIIVANVAPRGQIKEDGENGTRFGYFWHKNTLVVSTIKGYILSLVKKLHILERVNVLETKDVLGFALKEKLIDKNLYEYIANSQFRSFDFAPRVARWLWDRRNVPSSKLGIKDAPNTVWLVDSFGNIKTNLLVEDILNMKRLKDTPQKIKTNLGEFNFYERLKLVPDGETAVYIGSSGIGNKRFLEVATQNREGSAAKRLKLKIGDLIKIK